MSVLTDFKQAIANAKTVEVTNHYIQRVDHKAFGTTVRRVDRWNTAGFYLTYEGDDRPHRIEWPKASMIGCTPGARHWNIDYPGKPGVQFLTIRVVETR
jgi:hypothetical protein